VGQSEAHDSAAHDGHFKPPMGHPGGLSTSCEGRVRRAHAPGSRGPGRAATTVSPLLEPLGRRHDHLFLAPPIPTSFRGFSGPTLTFAGRIRPPWTRVTTLGVAVLPQAFSRLSGFHGVPQRFFNAAG
jgi:hypothetical protein